MYHVIHNPRAVARNFVNFFQRGFCKIRNHARFLKSGIVYDTVLVLHIIGFLNTGHSSAQGNQALMDILAVLQWVQDNIAAFNGDPNKVTLFGHGHGAALVNILMFSSLTEKGITGTLL